MVSRPITLSLLFVATAAAASSSSSSSPRHLRTASSSQTDVASAQSPDSSSSQDVVVPDVDESRTLQGVAVSQKCLNTLAASANENGKISKENYFVFTDGMSNGYYSYNNMTSYSDLSMEMKFGFVTLSCACHQQGGSGNCCQGDRAKLDVQGIDPEDPESMPDELKDYVIDICSVTSQGIGDNVMPPTGELPTTAEPTASAVPSSSPSASGWPSNTPSSAPTAKPTKTPTPEPSASPTPKEFPEVVVPPGGNPNGGNNGTDADEGGVSGIAWAGIAIAGAAVVTLFIYLLSGGNTKQREFPAIEDDNLEEEMSVHNNGKELLLITNGDGMDMDPDAPPRMESPDATNSMTASDVSSIPSMSTGKSGGDRKGTSEYYANNNLLPGRPDEESVLSSSDGPSFFADTSGEGMELLDNSVLNSSAMSGSSSGGDNLDQAIESGNWEAVAASAVAIVKQNESNNSISSGVEVYSHSSNNIAEV